MQFSCLAASPLDYYRKIPTCDTYALSLVLRSLAGLPHFAAVPPRPAVVTCHTPPVEGKSGIAHTGEGGRGTLPRFFLGCVSRARGFLSTVGHVTGAPGYVKLRSGAVGRAHNPLRFVRWHSAAVTNRVYFVREVQAQAQAVPKVIVTRKPRAAGWPDAPAVKLGRPKSRLSGAETHRD
jgi:hypothetical protein